MTCDDFRRVFGCGENLELIVAAFEHDASCPACQEWRVEMAKRSEMKLTDAERAELLARKEILKAKTARDKTLTERIKRALENNR